MDCPVLVDQRFTKEGNGWRLGWDATAPCYKGLLGGKAWAIELTEAEFHTFRRLVLEISQTMGAIAAELMEAERVTCEAEADDLWLEAEGFPDAYSLRFVLAAGRRCEGEWDAVAAQHIVQAIHYLALF
ncbi:DUF1818 family protein [Nodosilinea sp. LEGE 06152]|uniref:DUF1818 family protein n=1 Tax=Nodosilinea sp. LEGE 06152 TaxID=2777966 RepID=UPI00187EBB86|nr:DUF1818 family protein [Nodosilinea sp. LEGE 06152]MBE9157125.1 DUF1818 family protein [Nodosilinea sp. LEGE 06152]